MPEPLLPEPFRDLEPLVEAWALPGERQRNRKRLAGTMEENRAFYDAVAARAVDALEHLKSFPCSDVAAEDGGLPPAERRLLLLLFALAEVTPAVEVFGEPAVIGGFESARFVPDHDLPGWR